MPVRRTQHMKSLRGVLAAALTMVLAQGWMTTSPAAAQDAAPNIDKKVSLNLENADLQYALKLLFTSAGVNYTLDQSVQGTVTVSLTDVPFKTALESVLRSTQSVSPFTYRVEGGVYTISPKIEQVVDTNTLGEDKDTPVTPKSRAVKIQVNFVDALLLSVSLGGDIIQLGDGSL